MLDLALSANTLAEQEDILTRGILLVTHHHLSLGSFRRLRDTGIPLGHVSRPWSDVDLLSIDTEGTVVLVLRALLALNAHSSLVNGHGDVAI